MKKLILETLMLLLACASMPGAVVEDEALSEKPFEILETIEDNADFRVLRVRARGYYEGKDSLDYGTARARAAAENNAVSAPGRSGFVNTIEHHSSAGADNYARLSIFTSAGMLLDSRLVTSDFRKSPGGLMHSCEIETLVKVWKREQDPTFAFTAEPADAAQRAKVERFAAFTDGERIEFRVRSSLNAYLSIFWVGSDGTAQLVAQHDGDGLAPLRIQARRDYLIHDDFNIWLTCRLSDSAVTAQESGQLLFVATKRETAFPVSTNEAAGQTYQKLLKWLAGLSPDERRFVAVELKISK